MCPLIIFSQVTVPLHRVSFLFRRWLILASESVSLGLDALLSPLTSRLGLCTFGIHLFLEDPLTLLLGLGLVNLDELVVAHVLGRDPYMFNQGTLVLEGVTLAQLVEFVVEVLVDLSCSPVFDEKASENTKTSHP